MKCSTTLQVLKVLLTAVSSTKLRGMFFSGPDTKDRALFARNQDGSLGNYMRIKNEDDSQRRVMMTATN